MPTLHILLYLLPFHPLSSPSPRLSPFSTLYHLTPCHLRPRVRLQLVKGADPALHKKLLLETDPKAYKYMASCTDVASIDDKKELDEVLQAFKDLDISVAERDRLFTVVAGIAALGNVAFREAKHDQAEVDPASNKWAEAAAANIGVDAKVLSTALVTREIRVRGHDATRAVLNLVQANDARHALAKFMYGTSAPLVLHCSLRTPTCTSACTFEVHNRFRVSALAHLRTSSE